VPRHPPYERSGVSSNSGAHPPLFLPSVPLPLPPYSLTFSPSLPFLFPPIPPTYKATGCGERYPLAGLGRARPLNAFLSCATHSPKSANLLKVSATWTGTIIFEKLPGTRWPPGLCAPCPPHCYATAWAARGITFSTCPSVHACRDGRLLVVRVCLSDVRLHARPVGSSHRYVRAVSHRQRLARTQNNRTGCTFALLASAIRGSCKCCLACMWFCL